MRRWAAALLLFALPAAAETLAERIEKILEGPAARRAFWGVKAVDLATGETLYEHNADRLFVPASNTKLFTTALALARLGPEHRFLTRVTAPAAPDAGGRIAGDVVLIGGGDPNLSARVLPYDARRAFAGPPLGAIEELAEEVAALGVRRIDGDIVGDDTFFVWQRYGAGWAVQDVSEGYGAPAAALAVNDNTVTIEIRPGPRVGEPALVRLTPFAAAYEIDNRIVTVEARAAARPVRIERQPGDAALWLRGEIALGGAGRSDLLAIDDPALAAAGALREALLRRGVEVTGRAVCRHLLPHEMADLEAGTAGDLAAGVVLAARSSMPLVEALRVINKVSQNLHAEMVLRAVARARRGVGSLEAAAAEMKSFLTEAGLDAEEFFFRDGSGLSRLNLISPAAAVKLLAFMWNSPYRDAWIETLPVAAVDGTLKGRFAGTPAAERIRAKTGTLSHVSALAGYLEAPGGRRIAFAVLVNNFNAPAGAVRAQMDRLCVALSGW